MTNKDHQRHFALFLFTAGSQDTVEFYTGTSTHCFIIAKALQAIYTVMVVDYTDDAARFDEYTKYTINQLEDMWKRS